MARNKSQPPAQPDSDTRPDAVVWFDIPGVFRVGTYKPRTEYIVPAAEADRLCAVKGFQRGQINPAPTTTDETSQ
jgi:hypothetical protein